MRWCLILFVGIGLFGQTKQAVSRAPVTKSPKFILFPGVPVVDAGAIGEMVVNGIHLGIISGINAAELRNLEKIYDDVIKQGKPIEGWIWPGIQGSLPTLGSIATRGSGLGMARRPRRYLRRALSRVDHSER